MIVVPPSAMFALFMLIVVVIYLLFFSDSKPAGEATKGNQQNGGSKAASSNGVYTKMGGKAVVDKNAPRPKLNIFYGSQTGTAEEFARQLVKEARRCGSGFDATAVDLDTFNPMEMKACKAAVFLVATYGEGEPTDNSKDFIRWLRKGACKGDLEQLAYCVFGLGSSNYEMYNTMGKLVDQKCEKHGGMRLLKLCLGDEAKSMPDDWEKFRKKCLTVFCNHFHMEYTPDLAVDAATSSRVVVYKNEAEARKMCKLKSISMLDGETRHAMQLKVSATRELVKGGGGNRSCLHVELDDGGAGWIKYETGDHVGIYPENEAGKVAELAAHIATDLDAWISVEGENGESPFPCPCTLREALTCYLDIAAVPSKDTLKVLALGAGIPEERNMLEGMAHPQGYALYEGFILNEYKGILELLRDCPSVKLSLSKLFDVCPRLQPRYYSISSASNTHPSCLHVTCTVVRKEMSRGRVFEGVCSGYLSRLSVGDTVRCFTRTTEFKLPAEPSTPVILVGAGAGLAPLRAMAMHLDSERAAGTMIGQVMLVFGCRKRDEDYLYEEEILKWSRDKTLSHVINAFSREGAEKVYVQDKIVERSFDVLSVLNSGANVYVCGGVDMASEVRAAFVDALVEHVRVTEEQAEKFIDTIRRSRRYMQDVW